ncbi:transmembrane protein, putative (macronuclear) [Tetrahymena thermophila SB210]|uniref:Transmembrane protein, putative n=1 Tax=Tetrahymena thermophila (strain SB210) TaxID=312017 RepID=W7XJM6_TETTS|nr:transmembrane protein, putative [Tetrahymena thermophila SB210]EWS75671.1 transmembrane protein, putative [Tetrahymena thermophila SB210]|eukprot:XP_012651817.1 transmembrane protein, putative [Tetrahymena thermophila SB210]
MLANQNVYLSIQYQQINRYFKTCFQNILFIFSQILLIAFNLLYIKQHFKKIQQCYAKIVIKFPIVKAIANLYGFPVTTPKIEAKLIAQIHQPNIQFIKLFSVQHPNPINLYVNVKLGHQLLSSSSLEPPAAEEINGIQTHMINFKLQQY